LNNPNFLGRIIAVQTFQGHEYIGINSGFDEERHGITIRRAGLRLGAHLWYAKLEIAEGSIRGVREPEPKEVIEYMKRGRDSVDTLGTVN
jgi:hypothetical protein